MLISRDISSEDTKSSLMIPRMSYATEGLNIPLKKNWLESWVTLPHTFETLIEDILDFEVRSDDVFLVTFIKSGTTWMQETVWLLMNNLDFEKSKELHLGERSPFIDKNGFYLKAPNAIEFSKTVPSPRLIKSHMQANLLPRQIWQGKQKIIYVARNCKDVVVSSFHFLNDLGFLPGLKIEDYAEAFMKNQIIYTNYWTHVVDFWKMRHEPFIFFVTYEEMKRDMAGVVQRLCAFLGRSQLKSEELEQTLEHLSFASMRENKQTNLTTSIKEHAPNARDNFQFMRRGIVGSYKDELTPKLQAKIDNWSRTYLAHHGLTEEDICGRF